MFAYPTCTVNNVNTFHRHLTEDQGWCAQIDR